MGNVKKGGIVTDKEVEDGEISPTPREVIDKEKRKIHKKGFSSSCGGFVKIKQAHDPRTREGGA